MNDIWFFCQLFFPNRGLIIAGLSLSLVTAFASVGLLTLAGWFITSSAIAGLTAVDDVALSFNFVKPAAEIRALAILRTLGRYLERLSTHEVTFRALARIRVWFFGKIIPLAPGRINSIHSGDLLSRLMVDIDALDAIYLRIAIPMMSTLLGGAAIAFFIYYHDFGIGMTVLLMLMPGAVFPHFIFLQPWKNTADKMALRSALLRTRVMDIHQGQLELTAYRTDRQYGKSAITLAGQYTDSQRTHNRLSGYSSVTCFLIFQGAFILMLITGLVSYQEQRLSGPELVMLLFCVMALYELMIPVPVAMQFLGKTQKSAARIREIAELPVMINEPEMPGQLPDHFELSIQQASFKYPGRQPWVFQDLDLDIPQGRRIAIKGASGAGKTSLLSLLLRYYDPLYGTLSLGGVEYTKLNSVELLSCFGVLSQHTQLFAGSILDNILMGNAEASEQQIFSAIDAAGLTPFISSLSEREMTWIGENGAKVSGGEARRIALARVYLKDAPILLLDEPTEGLDAKTEKEVLKSMDILAEGKSLVLVTHRTTGLELVDDLYYMELGNLIKK